MRGIGNMMTVSILFIYVTLCIFFIPEDCVCQTILDSALRSWWKRLHIHGNQPIKQPTQFVVSTDSTDTLSTDTFRDETTTTYGMDISFPMHSPSVSSSILGNNRQELYEQFIQGCRDHWKDKGYMCDSVEQDRLHQNLWQPRYMVVRFIYTLFLYTGQHMNMVKNDFSGYKNFTETGYKKIRAPESLFKLLREFWEKNRHRETKESWFTGNIFTNYWSSPSQMISMYDTENEGGGANLATTVSEATREIIEEWTGMNLTSTSVYGIRVYKRGAVLSPHVDRLPLISSAIINVAQDVEEPWPLEVIGHDGIARNITMEPGDLVLYESHSIMHGRPFALNGTYFANVFIHFEPLKMQEHESKIPLYISNYTDAVEWYKNEVGINDDHDDEEEDADSDEIQDYDEDNTIHVDLIEDDDNDETVSENIDQDEEQDFTDAGETLQDYEDYEYSNEDQTYGTYSDDQHEAHLAAGDGDLRLLQNIVGENNDSIHYVDKNGWTPAHEAARGLHLEILTFLYENGADFNAKTAKGEGVLDVAISAGGANHPVVRFLSQFIGDIDDKASYFSRDIDMVTLEEVDVDNYADYIDESEVDMQDEPVYTEYWSGDEDSTPSEFSIADTELDMQEESVDAEYWSEDDDPATMDEQYSYSIEDDADAHWETSQDINTDRRDIYNVIDSDTFDETQSIGNHQTEADEYLAMDAGDDLNSPIAVDKEDDVRETAPEVSRVDYGTHNVGYFKVDNEVQDMIFHAVDGDYQRETNQDGIINVDTDRNVKDKSHEGTNEEL